MNDLIIFFKALIGQIKDWTPQEAILNLKADFFQMFSKESRPELLEGLVIEAVAELLVWVLEWLYVRHVGDLPVWWTYVKVVLKIVLFWLLLGHLPWLTLIVGLMELGHAVHTRSKKNSLKKGKSN